jgi:predicted amidophosphoribosyltransferase
MKGAFEVTQSRKADLFGKRVVLVDDVYTTGATVSAATRVLKRAGAVKVDVLTFAMAIASSDVAII